MTENELKTIVLRAARNNGWHVYHVPQANMRNGGGRGYPDLTMARDRGGVRQVMWIELKAEKGELTEEQMLWKALLSSYVIRPSDVTSGYLLELLK